MYILAGYALSFITSAALGCIVASAAKRLRLIDVPAAHRWNKAATPRMGGIAIMASAALFASSYYTPSSKWAVLGLLFIFLAGLIDDIQSLRPMEKFLLQIAAAVFAVKSGAVLPLSGIQLIDIAITLLWIVGFSNAFNLIDNMDGLCAGVSAVVAGFMAWHSALSGNMQLAGAMFMLSGACAGFLFCNFHPARIFMGDCGSMSIGYALSVAVLFALPSREAQTIDSLAVPLLVLLVPATDTAFVIITRFARGQSPASGGKDHISHRLAALGLSDRETAAGLCAVSVASGATSIIYIYSCAAAIVFAMISAAMLSGFLLWRLTPAGNQNIAH